MKSTKEDRVFELAGFDSHANGVGRFRDPRRVVEQSTGQPAICEPEQEQPDEPEQQQRVPVRPRRRADGQNPGLHGGGSERAVRASRPIPGTVNRGQAPAWGGSLSPHAGSRRAHQLDSGPAKRPVHWARAGPELGRGKSWKITRGERGPRRGPWRGDPDRLRAAWLCQPSPSAACWLGVTGP